MSVIPTNIKAVIFDVDGLMIDSEPTWEKTHDAFLSKHSIIMDEKERASLRGIGLKQLIIDLHKKFHLKQSVEDLLSEYRETFYKQFSSSGAMQTIAGVGEVARYFSDCGLQLAVATGGHGEKEMQQMLQSFNLLKYFQIVVSGDEVEKGKPYPDIFFVTAERLEVMPSQCLVLEDSVNGVKAGKAAGMVVWGVNSDEKIYNDLRENGADRVFPNLLEIKM